MAMPFRSHRSAAESEERARAIVEALFLEHYRGLCAYVRQYVHAMEAAEEIVQEVFLKVWDMLRKGPSSEITRSYLYTAVRNHALSVLRHERVVQAHEDASIVATLGEERPAGIEEGLVADELTRAVRAAVERLPPRRREAFILSRERGLTYPEIAKVLGITQSTVEQHITFALKQLRRVLESYRQ